MTRSIQFIRLMLIIACFCAVSLFYPEVGFTQSDPASPYFHVVNIDRSESPAVALTMSGGRAELIDAAELDVLEDGVSQAILQDRVEERALHLALMIDPRALDVVGATGQPRYLEIAGVMLKLLGDESVVASGDKVATFFAEQDGEIGTIQAWTEDPDLIFSSFIQQRADVLLDETSTIHDSLLSSVESFPAAAESTDLVKSILLFSAGIDDDGVSDATLNQLIEQLRLARIQVYVAHFGQQNQPAMPDQNLQQLAQRTNGQFLSINSEADFNGLLQRIADSHTQRIVSYESSQPEADEVSVQLTLADGSALVNRLSSDGEVIEMSMMDSTAMDDAAMDDAAMDDVVMDDAATDDAAMDESAESATDAGSELNSSGDTTSGSMDGANDGAADNTLSIPGTDFTLSSNWILGALAATFALLAYFLVADFRSRNAYKKRLNAITASGDPEMNTGSYRSSVAPDQFPPPPQEMARANVTLQSQEEMTRANVPHHVQPMNTQAMNTQPMNTQEMNTQVMNTQVVEQQKIEQYITHSEELQRAVQNNTRTIEVLVDRLQNQAPVNIGPASDAPINDADIILESGSIEVDSTPDGDEIITEVEIGDDYGNASLGQDFMARPIMGYLIRVTEDPRLPLQLPFYQYQADIEDGEELEIRIGRNGQRNDVVINSAGVSREHAVVLQKEGQLYLRDNQSTSGTSLNWRKLREGEEALLRNNDLINFGEVSYEFRAQDENESTAVVSK